VKLQGLLQARLDDFFAPSSLAQTYLGMTFNNPERNLIIEEMPDACPSMLRKFMVAMASLPKSLPLSSHKTSTISA
jgi:hypothetical protein